MADEKKSGGKKKALTQLEKDVYETFGMLPNEERLSILPRYKKGEGFIAPEFIYDALKAIQSPRTAMYSELGPEEALNVGLNFMGSSSIGSAPMGALQMGMAKPTLEPARRAALADAERALPLNLPRARPKSKEEIAAHAERVARQMMGEHVLSGKPKDAQNLAKRSKKESQRVQKLQYVLEPIKDLPPIEKVEPRIGDINIALPGDTTISDMILRSIEGVPIDSIQQGGSLFGLGKMDRNNPLFWASNEGPAQMVQDKITDIAGLFEAERVLAQHLAMGRVANNFAQHFADASLRAIDYSRMSAEDMNLFDSVIAGGFVKKDKKTGEKKLIDFPDWPGIADPEAALAAMKANPEMRKWFLSRMKTPKLTKATNMPNGLDIEWAITSPELRNMEVNLTGHSVGEMVPGAKLTDDADHETYTKGIRGLFLGQQENLTPFQLSFPDAAQHIASTQRPQDFTGTIQKVFPHQRVDQQYVDEYGEYMRQLDKKLRGQKDGGLAMRETEEGLAPHGMRHSGEGVKGSGYFGYLPASDGYATEMSAENEGGEFPLLVPTLSKEEIEHLLAGNSPTDEIFRKAVEHAERRKKEGKSPYADPTGLKHPVPKAEGGTVSYELPDDVTPQNWRDQLETNVLNDARALIGVKEGGPINLDRLLEKAVRKANGGPANLDDMLSWAVAKHNHKMKKGGEVSQTFPLKKDEEEERMFSPAPLKIPEPITDALEALKRQFEKEKRSMSKPGAVQDVLMRGPVAMYAGAPADIMGMGGELLDYVQKKIPGMRKPASVMDTGPEKVPPMGYAPAFPLAPEGPYGTEAAQDLMKQSGLTTGTERPLLELGTGVAAPFAGMAALKTGKALAPTAKDMLEFALEKSMEPYQMNVIKPEGGNWIQGAAEKYLKDLRYDESLIDPVGVMNPTAKAEETARVAAMNNFVDKKLSRYLVNQMGTPSDSLRLQADTWAETQKKLLADKDKQIDKVRSDIRKAQQARGVDPEVLTRSQARLRELQKERELINNRKGLHFAPQPDWFAGSTVDARARAGMPIENQGVSEIARSWEDLSDKTIRQGSYSEQLPFMDVGLGESAVERFKTLSPMEKVNFVENYKNEQLQKLGGQYAVDNPEALAYGMNTGIPARDLRFDHMMDEIDNALRPSQGLPDYLQLKPKDLDKMSVAEVSEHVDKINAWRASQKAEVDAARAANAATVEHKAYDVVPGTDIPNDQGLRWVEIKAPEVTSPDQLTNPDAISKYKQYLSTAPDNPEVQQSALQRAAKIQNESFVEDALKYEGEILQHCVGGYCPDVTEGRSRIFSLRDADGRPHATIETKPIKETGRRSDIPDDIKEELRARGEAIGRQKADELGFGPYSEEAALEEKIAIAQVMDDWLYENPLVSEKIAQIKGLQNRKPNDEYMPFIQDFVKSGQWSHVKDLENSDLRKVAPDSALATKMKAAGVEPPLYVSSDELSQLLKQYKEGLYSWKRGGRVTKADLEQQFRMAFGGGVFNTDPDITDSGRIIPEHTI
jgi:hypothetical protein